MTRLLTTGREARGRLPVTLTLASGRHHTAETILRAWFEGKSPHTIRSYQHDLEDFALFLTRALGASPRFTVSQALSALFRQSVESAHEIALAFRKHLMDAGLAPASVNRHLAALRSLSKLGRMLGIASWHLEVEGVRQEKRRATAGPRVEDVQRMLALTSGDSEAETRDAAIVLTFYCMGLRVSELCGLDLQDTDLEAGATWIRGKGRRERELVPMPAAVVAAVRRYLPYRGTTVGPLFQTRGLRGRARDGRLETRSVLRIIRRLGQRAGVHVWCQGLRHTSITQAAELGQRAGFGLDKIRAHSRHRHITTLMLYIDDHQRGETQRTLADLVAGSLQRPTPKDGA